jgi:hypothetical protein
MHGVTVTDDPFPGGFNGGVAGKHAFSNFPWEPLVDLFTHTILSSMFFPLYAWQTGFWQPLQASRSCTQGVFVG